MKAMVLTGPGALTAVDVARPKAAAGQVLVRVTHSGICGTDLKIFRGDIPVSYPRIMGHEMIGEVVDGGDHGPGTRVIVDPVVFCGHCFHCTRGQTHLCPAGHVLGRDRDGGFADYMLAPEDAVFPLPEAIAGPEAVLIQVLTTCVHAQRLAPVGAGETVVVLGLGVAGQFQVQLAKANGAGRVIGVTRSPWRRELAERLGADETLAPGEGVAKRIAELTDGRGADLVIESVGNLAVLAGAIALARIGGRLMNFGIYTATQGALPFYQLYYKELTIINPRAAKREDYPAAIELVTGGAVRLTPMVSHALPLRDLERAVTMLETGDERRMKVILEHG